MMTTGSATCPRCQTALRFSVQGAPERLRLRCTSCDRLFTVRRPAEAAPPAPEASPTPPPTSETPPRPLETTRLEPAPTVAVPVRAAVRGRFAAGDLVAGRYRVTRLIDRGGMGEVYEAHDLELEQAVALKALRPDLASNEGSAERFKREILLARKVTHPNVCRIFDVSHHPASPAEGEEQVIFLTMELLEGETLAHRLAREGPLSPTEALPLVSQLAAALDAAHQAGVVHRDFKTGNVMLVPAGGGLRAVVTDFGLARETSGTPFGATLTADGGVLGTPEYLAPEQVEGGEATAAVDVYALGVVLFETVTGWLPFRGENPLATAVRRLREPPPSPRVHRPDLDPRWEATILRCLARRPEERFTTAGEVVRTLESEEAPAAPPSGPQPGLAAGLSEATAAGPSAVAMAAGQPAKRWGDRLKVLGLLALILVSAALAYQRYTAWKARSDTVRQALGLPSGPVTLRRAVAVLGLRDLSGDPDSAWLATAVAEMLRSELRAGEELRIVGGDEIARMEIDLPLEDTDSLSPDRLRRVRRILGADAVVHGSYATLGEGGERRLRLDLHLQDAASGATLASLAETGREAELFDLVSRAGARLRERLGMAAAGSEEAARAALPATPEAASLYAEGLEKLRLFDPQGARDLLEKAAQAEPSNPLIHSALSSAWGSLGYEERARQEARQALQLSADLPREERLAIEARSLETAGDWPRAAEAYRSLWGQFPDNLEYGLSLAAAQTRAGRGPEALTVTALLRSLPPPAGEDPRIDLAEAEAAASLAEAERQRAAAARAAAAAEQQGTRLLVAQARLVECGALRNLGRPEEARSACEEGRSLYAAAGDRAGVAAALTGIANVLYHQGELAGARERFEESLAAYREMGNLGGAAGVLNNLAVVLRNLGETETARGHYEEVLALSQEIGSRDGEAYALNNLSTLLIEQGELAAARERLERVLEIRRASGDRRGEASALDQLGVVLHRQGYLAAATRRHEEALALGREIGLRRGEAVSLNHLARVAFDRGDLAGARQGLERSLALSEEIGYRSQAASALFGLAEVAFEEGRTVEALRRHREALGIREELGERGSAAESRTALARVLAAGGEPEEAETLARRAAEEQAALGAPDAEARALLTLARALHVRGDRAEARRQALRAAELGAASENPAVRLATTVEKARADGFAGRPGAAAALDAAREEAERVGLVPLALEARLARLEVAAGADLEAVRREADALADDALERDFERVALAAFETFEALEAREALEAAEP